jgi:hypothetical protein
MRSSCVPLWRRQACQLVRSRKTRGSWLFDNPGFLPQPRLTSVAAYFFRWRTTLSFILAFLQTQFIKPEYIVDI